jgi:hypothetical protein
LQRGTQDAETMRCRAGHRGEAALPLFGVELELLPDCRSTAEIDLAEPTVPFEHRHHDDAAIH